MLAFFVVCRRKREKQQGERTVDWTAMLCWGAFGSAFRRLYAAHRRAFSTVMALSLVYCAITALK